MYIFQKNIIKKYQKESKNQQILKNIAANGFDPPTSEL